MAVCTLGVIGEKKNNANELDQVLDAYSNIISNIAAEYKISLIDLRSIFKNMRPNTIRPTMIKAFLQQMLFT